MKRADFIQIIKLRSFWKIDKRKGNYKLPNGSHLRDYVERLVDSQLTLDGLGINKDGNLVDCTEPTTLFGDYTLMPAFAANETCSYDEMQKRYNALIREIIGM